MVLSSKSLYRIVWSTIASKLFHCSEIRKHHGLLVIDILKVDSSKFVSWLKLEESDRNIKGVQSEHSIKRKLSPTLTLNFAIMPTLTLPK